LVGGKNAGRKKNLNKEKRCKQRRKGERSSRILREKVESALKMLLEILYGNNHATKLGEEKKMKIQEKNKDSEGGKIS